MKKALFLFSTLALAACNNAGKKNAAQTDSTVVAAPVTDSLPAGGYNNHWTRNVVARPDGSKIYVSVGSGSNVGENGMENEARRACIIEVNPDGSGERILASGLRNPVGMDWAPGTQTLYTVVNERDNLGDDLVPDYQPGLLPMHRATKYTAGR